MLLKLEYRARAAGVEARKHVAQQDQHQGASLRGAAGPSSSPLRWRVRHSRFEDDVIESNGHDDVSPPALPVCPGNYTGASSCAIACRQAPVLRLRPEFTPHVQEIIVHNNQARRSANSMTCSAVLLLTFATAALCQNRAEWLRQARWGVFMHYLAETPDVPVEEWNRRINGFDTVGLARQLESIKAGYFVITLGQNSGHYISPNRTYDRLVGIKPSKCSTRDLVADLYSELEPRGIKLMVYLPSGAPDQDVTAVEKLSWRKGAFRNAGFQEKWESVIAEWSARWGTRVKGWWFDGCYWPNTMYRTPNPPNFSSFAAAARKGNPSAVLAFNRGVVVPIHSETPEEDYTAGEINDPTTVTNAEFWRDGAQFHMLSFLGKTWSAGPARFSEEQVATITKKLVESGGAVTWDVPHDENGLIPEEFLTRLRAAGRAVLGKKD